MENGSSTTECGIVYMVIGNSENYIKEFKRSYFSLRKFYKGGVTLITNSDISLEGVDVISVDCENLDWFRMVLNKPKYLKLSPYKKTIFLDSDTLIIEDFSEMFDILSHFDFCATLSPMDYAWPRVGGKKMIGYLPHNTGVIGFNCNSKCMDVFEDWYSLYEERINLELSGNDQTPFMESLYKNQASICTLPFNYNLRTNFPGNLVAGKVCILHDRTLPQKFVNSINESLEIRLIEKSKYIK